MLAAAAQAACRWQTQLHQLRPAAAAPAAVPATPSVVWSQCS
jgi:hypothetical protein